MLEEALAAGDKALVFTQFREMGDRLARAPRRRRSGARCCSCTAARPRRARDEMVRRFQEEPRGPRVFVLSVKAGGTGLNLTAANHVFHYDRWWNPAVEDQATDRAYRIGQKRAVQVHKLVCAGTVEEKIDRAARAEARARGARWWARASSGSPSSATRELRELFALSKGAVGGDASDEDATHRRRARRRDAAARGGAAMSRWRSAGATPARRSRRPSTASR